MFFALAISFTKIQGWIATVGYPALFGLLLACGLGLPLPEDIPLIIAGALIAKGSMTWFWAAICAWCGIIGGDCMLYLLGRKFGQEITRVPFVGKHITKERLQSVEVLFEKYGVGVVGVGRLFAGIRGAMVVCAGTIRFNFIKFIIADGIAAIVSGGLFMLLGHWLGSNLTEERIARYKHWITLATILMAASFVAWIIWKRRHKQQVMEKDLRRFEKVVKVETKIAEKIGVRGEGRGARGGEAGSGMGEGGSRIENRVSKIEDRESRNEDR